LLSSDLCGGSLHLGAFELVALNLAGIVADTVAYARDDRRPNMGVANYMMIAQKPPA